MSLKYVILGLLCERPHYGYEIKQRFEQSAGDIWPLSYGQLYPTLRRLTLSQCISMQTVPGKRSIDKNVYTVAEKGRREFQEWFERRTKKSQIAVKDEFTLFMYFASTIDPERIAPVARRNHDVVSRQQAIYQTRLEGLGDSAPVFQRALIKKVILHLEAERIWLEEMMIEQGIEQRSARRV